MRYLAICLLSLTLFSQFAISNNAHAEPGSASAVLDVDGNGQTEPLKDGLLILRYLFDYRGNSLIDKAMGSGATRTTASQVETYIKANLSTLDVDGNGKTEPLTDGLLIVRYLFEFRGSVLIDKAMGAGATRTTATEIETYIEGMDFATDTTPPVITILGDNPATVQQGATYTDAGATAVDDVDGNVVVTSSGTVDTSTAGSYTITYTASDSAGNSVTASRAVNVEANREPKVKLDISFFGEGNVNILSQNSVTCDTPRFCSGLFDKGTTIVVEANPTSGWSFDGWNNCDSTDSTKCTITVNSDTLITTAFHSDEPLKLHNNVIVLSDDQVRAITDYSHDSGVLVFQAGTNTNDFKVGNILVSKGIYIGKDNTNNIETYFARRITRVVALSGSPVVLTTTEASLEDVIQSGTLSYQKEITQAQLPSSLPRGVSLRRDAVVSSKVIPLQIDVVLYDKDGDYNTVNDQVKAKGSIDYTITPDFDFNFALFRGITEFRAIMRATSKSDLKLIVGGEVKLADGKIPVTSFKLIPITLGPVVILPEVAIKINYEAKVSAEVGPKLEVSTSVNAGVHYLKDHGWRNLGSFKFDPKVTIDLDVKASAQAGPSIELATLLYGVAGPNISFNGFVGFEVFPVIPAKNGCFFDYAGFTGVDARFGGEISILGKGLKYEAKLLEKKWNFDWATGGCSVEDTEIPSSPTLSIGDVTTDTITFAWTDSVDNVGIKGYKLYRNHQILANTVAGTSYLDRSLKAGSGYCYYLVAVDTSGNESTISNAECATTKTLDITPPSSPINVIAKAKSTTAIEVTWSEASDDTAVTGYIVLDNTNVDIAPYIVQQTSDLSLIVSGLIPETEYCYIVSALDKVGNVSGASSRVCATTKKQEQSNWLIKMGCQGRNYILEQNLDLDEDVSSVISVTGTGQDYNGTNLSYSLSGTYNIHTYSLDANIIWTFEGSSKRRRDTFVADLSTSDTGDINMTQVEITGCDGKIRFIKKDNQSSSSRRIELNDSKNYIDNSLNFLMH